MVQVVSAHPTALHHMVLAAVDHIGVDAQGLHHRGRRAAHIVGRPFAAGALGKHQGVVVAALLQRFGALLELGLAVAHLLGDGLHTHMAVLHMPGGKAPAGIAGEDMQGLELAQGEVGQEDQLILLFADTALDVLPRDEPLALLQIDMLPFGHQ